MSKVGKISEEEIKVWLEEVKDPEIPVLSLNDLGVITGIDIADNGKVTVNMTPTFTGCPAMDVMKSDVEDVLRKKEIQDFEVRLTFETQWNSNMISEKGRAALKKFGLAPPPQHNLIVDIDLLEHAICPQCNSENTVMKSPFGPALCRSLHYCNNCHQAFEQFKPL
ncbi:MAG: phenylacetate-CoA oxygenase subunit PaaJ [Cytophagales bacterium CG12_big_fil_rev_8_21_14_0_65_40_12]|nr:MAG: phenylacetate-CoA oxygenase subunit PaaJ [Cytophagales bacterium CG12_big_fil_rev_8_21_14_0_65_40_12]PIW02945.1 MAG: phenylacetate-CoA oxygenase subunit PaaJ [Cytophagales bacterium CG17_big_fil_post_rev_8_21_14_2_50_40_13]